MFDRHLIRYIHFYRLYRFTINLSISVDFGRFSLNLCTSDMILPYVSAKEIQISMYQYFLTYHFLNIILWKKQILSGIRQRTLWLMIYIKLF